MSAIAFHTTPRMIVQPGLSGKAAPARMTSDAMLQTRLPANDPRTAGDALAIQIAAW